VMLGFEPTPGFAQGAALADRETCAP